MEFKEYPKTNNSTFQKKVLKYLIIWLIILCSWYLIFDKPSIYDIKTVAEAEKLMDEYINDYEKQYKNLCEKVRNDNLKNEFSILGGKIHYLYTIAQEFKNLSYSEQSEVSHYIMNHLNSDLKQLADYSMINCW